MRFILKLGWNAMPLREQLQRDDAEVAQWQALSDAITHLQNEGLITFEAARRARKRLAEAIGDAHGQRRQARQVA